VSGVGAFVHDALLYRNEGDYLNGVASFAEAGVTAGEPVLIAVPGSRLDRLRERLADADDRITYADMSRAGANPGRIIPGVLHAFAASHPGRRVHIVGEPIWPGRPTLEYPACVQHEALINTAFDGRDAAILCPYDLSGLSPIAVMDARRTHPVLIEGARRRSSPGYTDPVALAAEYNRPLPDPPVSAITRPIAFTELSAVRRLVADQASAAGLDPDRAADLTVAVNELATNSIEHGGGTGTLTVWRTDEHLVCEVSDRGHIADPMAGREPRDPESARRRGLLTVHLLGDLVRIYTRPGLTTVRVYMRIGGRHGAAARYPLTDPASSPRTK
jgi:anti-sigma regulatory factor (Ser/Thr protein kinase)